MKYKQLILRKIFELNNLINGQKALISTARSREEIQAQLEKVESKLHEIEVLINSESEN
jgi:hypothetical protein